MKTTKEKTSNPYIVYILKEMCKRVDANYDEIDFKKDLWFMEYEWSKKEEQSFVDWLADYLYNNKEARQNIVCSYCNKTKKNMRNVAEEFNWQFGWKTKS